jgi:hypothetical protein
MAASILPFPPEIDRDHFARWLCGFTDGEGSFVLRLHRCQPPYRPSPGAGFQITLRSDDSKVLEHVQAFWRCGAIYPVPARGTMNSQVKFVINATRSLWRVVVPHFDRFPLLAKKRQDYAIWRQGVDLLCRVRARRRCRRLIGKHGFYSRWADAEYDHFMSLFAAIKQQRLFQPDVRKAAPESPALPSPARDPSCQLTFFGPEE